MKLYFPTHDENRMKSEGDVAAAREYFCSGENRVLYHLIKQRFSWMNDYIRPTDETVIELGCGAGLSEFFITTDKLILTDVADHEWVDRYVDAMDIDYPSESVDVIICSHMIHHLSNPASFLDMLGDVLKPGGRIIIQDIYTCALMKLALRVMRHEGWSEVVDVFDRDSVCNDPVDPWSANCSIPKLLFWKDENRFHQEFPQFEVIKKERNECLLFLSSGGVIAKTFHLPVGDKGAEVIEKTDRFLVKAAPALFACGCSVVLEKK